MPYIDLPPRQINTALFVDFDNVFITLQNQEPQIAHQFAANPERWLIWLEQQLPPLQPSMERLHRRILIRRCYLNPQSFANYRPYFIRSAFEVVDCPPLTMRGKTSTDIHLVMDVLEVLLQPTQVSEFIILSGDADFTPLLLKIRKHDRWSAALSIGYVSPAYKAACDYLITQEAFVKDALGVTHDDAFEPAPEAAPQTTQVVLRKMAARLYDAASDPLGIEASDLPAIYREFPDFRLGSNWLGFYSLRRLTEELVELRSDLVILEEDPWRVARRQLPDQAGATTPMPASSAQKPAGGDDSQRAALAEWIISTVRSAGHPVVMAVLAQAVHERFGESIRRSAWLGAGSFKSLLMQLDLDGLKLSSRIPGYVYDPERHEAPAEEGMDGPGISMPDRGDAFLLRYPELAPLARKINRLTETPYLVPEHYALLLTELARDINEHGYQMSRTSKTVRDRCVEQGVPIARSHVNFVLIGISYTGHRLGEHGREDPRQLGEVLFLNTLNLCRTAQLELTDNELEQVREWIMSGLHERDERVGTGH